MEIRCDATLCGCKRGDLRQISSLFRCARRDRERMHGPCQLLGERRVDSPLPLYPAEPRESRRDDLHIEMRLAFGAMAGMALVALGIIDHLQALGREGGLELR